MTQTTLTEVKNVAYLRLTPQLQDYLLWAEQEGLQFNLIVRANTVVSGPLQEMIDNPDIPITLMRDLPPL